MLRGEPSSGGPILRVLPCGLTVTYPSHEHDSMPPKKRPQRATSKKPQRKPPQKVIGNTPTRLAYKIRDVGPLIGGVDVSTVYALCRAGALRYQRLSGGQMIVSHQAILDYLEGAERTAS